MNTVLLVLFVAGYAAIAFEKSIRIDKAATALITGVACWVVYALMGPEKFLASAQLTDHLGNVSGILFFLLGAMTIVELIDAHNGFDLVAGIITTTNKRKLLWLISLITFFLSPILDNLTTTIVMIALVRKLVPEKEDRLWFAGMIIISSNAGGAWSPIGDVTTTMLWIGGQISAGAIILSLFVPAVICMLVPLIILSLRLKGFVVPGSSGQAPASRIDKRKSSIVFFAGLIVLMLVPVFKTTTGLPPYMGVLLGLGLLWIITEILHGNDPGPEKEEFSVSRALRRIDSPSILFFLGILLSIAALESSGLLHSFANQLDKTLGNDDVTGVLLGALSAIIDNVPLVAAAQGMYGLDQFPPDHHFWHLIALTTGTGGSMLIIGSAAGVAAMGMEKIGFFWYLKKISWLAFAGYAAAIAIYLLQRQL